MIADLLMLEPSPTAVDMCTHIHNTHTYIHTHMNTHHKSENRGINTEDVLMYSMASWTVFGQVVISLSMICIMVPSPLGMEPDGAVVDA